MATTWLKPAGTTVFPRRKGEGPLSILELLLLEQPWRTEVAWPEGFDGGIAHRLDLHTSGALWIADDLDELTEIRKRFASRKLVKRYRFLASKEVQWDHNKCDLDLAHDRRKKGKMVVRRGASTPHRGRWFPAKTHFSRVVHPIWNVRMQTGVMHQIRVHAAFLGVPILGDTKYGGGPAPDFAPSGGFFLHHLGLADTDGWGTEEVALPDWANPDSNLW